jgi:hypothetical protein
MTVHGSESPFHPPCIVHQYEYPARSLQIGREVEVVRLPACCTAGKDRPCSTQENLLMRGKGTGEVYLSRRSW